MNRSLVAQFVLRLQDRASAGLSAVQRRLEGLRRTAGRAAIAAVALGGLSFATAISSAAALEGRLRDMSITAGRAGPEVAAAVDATRGELNRLAREFRESTGELLGGMEVLVARGIEGERLRPFIRTIAEVRSASGAASADLAQLAVTLDRVMKITDAGEQRTAFAQMFRAGQLGGAELSDMARYLPGILAGMDAMGVSGLRGVQNASAMFQVLRDGFGTTSEAASGMQQMLGQLLSPDTRKKMEETLGIDVMAVFRDAQRRQAAGEDVDPVEALLGRIRQQTQGQREAFFETIQDQNARQAMMAFVNGAERYIEIRNELRATDGQALVQSGADRREGLAAEMRRLSEAAGVLQDRLGNAFTPAIAAVNGGLERMADFIDRMNRDYPGLTETIGVGLAAFAGLVTVLGLIGALAGPVAAGFALLASPIVLAGVAIGAVAIYIWREWERFSGFFASMADGLVSIASGIGEYFAGLFTADAQRSVDGMIQVWTGLSTFFAGLWGTVRTLFGDFATFLDGWTGGAITGAVEAVRAAFAPLTAFFEGLWGGITAAFDAAIGGITGALGRVQGVWDGLRARLPGFMGGTAPAAPGQPATAAPAVPVAPPVPAAANQYEARVGGEIVVRAAPGTEVLSATGTNDRVPISAPDRGQTRGRR